MNMKKMNVTNRMYEAGALAIVRAETLDRACEIAEGCMKGGVPVMEMSYTLNNAGDIIQGLSEKYGDALCVGAGTVLDADQHDTQSCMVLLLSLPRTIMKRSQKCAIATRFPMHRDVPPLPNVLMR